MLETDRSFKEFRKNWARLIKKIYEVDPLTCPKCSSEKRVISVIEDEEVVKKILKHLELLEREDRPSPKAIKPQIDFSTDYLNSQVPPCDDYLYCDPEYPIETMPEHIPQLSNELVTIKSDTQRMAFFRLGFFISATIYCIVALC